MKKWPSIVSLFFLGIIFIQADLNDEPPLSKMAALGKELFNEKILSLDSTVSCSSCHKPAYAFADTVAFSVGIHGKLTKRNTPTVLNMKNRPYYFWDGRAGTLEQQALMPIQNPDEMGLPIAMAVERLNNNEHYSSLFQQIFKDRVNDHHLSAALAAYEKTLETVNSKFDDWSNNKGKLSPMEEAGRQVFLSEKAKCFDCHFMEDFTNDGYKNIGLFDGKQYNDSGHYLFSKQPKDIGRFKTPGLRNIAVTAPYMHNGMFKTLEEVVDYYNDPNKVIANPVNRDPTFLKPLGLSDKEKKALVAFLKTLTDKAFISNNFNK